MLKNQKKGNTRTISFLNIPLYQVEKQKDFKVQRFLGGIVIANKFLSKKQIIKEIKIFGMPFNQYVQIGNIRTYYFFNYKYKECDLGNIFYQKHKKLFDQYDDIYILHANIGESVLFLKLAKSYFKKNGSNKPLFIGSQNYHKDLVELLCPDIPVVIIRGINISLYEDKFKVNGNKTFRLLFSKPYFDSVEDNIRDKNNSTIHFKTQMLNYLGLEDKDFSNDAINISNETRKSLQEKIAKTNLDLGNFVIFTPEANTCEDYEFEFWQQLKTKYESQGIDVFCNVVQSINKVKFNKFKQCDLTLGELYELTKMAKELIGLRSGLLDLLVLTNTPMKVLYTNAKNRYSFNPLTSEEMMSGFNMQEYLNVKECNVMDKDKQEILEKF